MKKIIFSAMIASLLAFAGCQNEELVNDNNTPNGGEKVILTANIQGSAQTRLALTAGTDNNDKPIVKVAWREYDENNPETFFVVGANGMESFTQVSDTEFSGTLPEPYDGSYVALYNLNLFNNFGNHKHFTFKQDGTLREQDMMMMASFNEDDTSIEFQHQMSILKPTFKVGEDTVNNTITHIEMGEISCCTTTVVINVEPTAPATTLENDIYLTIPILEEISSSSDSHNFNPGETFNFAVTANGNDYTGSLTIPNIANWEPEGKLFTATIALTEVCNLPKGTDFNGAISNIPNSDDVTAIEFVANLGDAEMVGATSFSAINMPPSAKYKIIDTDGTNPKTLKICTDAEVFMFNADCSCMFQYRGNYLNKITSIEFNNCVNTENVMNMNNMFGNSNALKELDLSYFVTSNVIDMGSMFTRCHNLTSLDIRNFNVNKVTNFSSMFYMVGSKLPSGSKTKIYVASPNPFEGKSTNIDSSNTKAEYVVVP